MNRMQSRDVFLVENYLAPISRRRHIIKTLLERLNVPRIYFVNSSSASMLACGGDTGIVVDVGYREIRVVPVCYGAVQNFAIKYRPGGHVAIRKRIVEQIPKLKELGSDELDRFLRTVCTVRINKETESKEEEEKDATIEFETKSGVVITVPESSRWKPCEVLFEKDQDGEDFVTTFLDAVMHCPVDVRALVVQNVIVLGGVVAAFPNMAQRMETELKRASSKTHPEHLLAVSCVQKSLRIRRSVLFPADHVAWTGASILASSENPKLLNGIRSVTKESYNDGLDVPDEFSLLK